MNSPNETRKPYGQVFERRFDFYWKSVAIYSIVLITYSLLRGTIEQGQLTMAISDPLVIFLALAIVFSIFVYFFNVWKAPKIQILNDKIILKTRFFEKKISTNEIVHISMSLKKLYNLPDPLKVFKIYTLNRKKPYRIRVSSFWNDKELAEAILNFKKANRK